MTPGSCRICAKRKASKLYTIPGESMSYHVCSRCFNKLRHNDREDQKLQEAAHEVIAPDAWAEQEQEYE